MSKTRTGKRKSKKSCERSCLSKDILPQADHDREFDHLAVAEVTSEKLLSHMAIT